MTKSSLRNDRKGGIAIMASLLLVPLTGMVGLAIDYSLYTQTVSSLNIAANTAALNAVKTASAAALIGDANFIQEGVTAGKQWFAAQTGTYAGKLNTLTPTVSVTGTTVVTSTVTYTGTVTSFFGALFGTATYPVNVVATAISPTAPFLNVEVMLDNSPSMLIGATNADQEQMMTLTACSSAGQNAGQSYSAYSVNAGGYKYDGTLTQPTGYVAGGATPTCTAQMEAVLPKAYTALYPTPKSLTATAPCAFACHFDTSKAAGTGNDYLGLARSTIGTTTPITLRFDVVKAAVRSLISTMQADNLSINNLGVGVFAFNAPSPSNSTGLTQVYPTSGEAGNNWSAALTAVGAPPAAFGQAETGVTAVGGGNSAGTNFPSTMTTLSETLTKSGSGTSATDPRKVLFVVTDGVEDYLDANNNRIQAAIDPSKCQTFKDMGYNVYVIYTPYQPLMNAYYLQTMVTLAEGTGPGSVTYNLQACASSSNNYLVASDQASLTTAFQTFLKQAMVAPVRFTK